MNNHPEHVIACNAAFIIRDLLPSYREHPEAEKHCKILADLTPEQWKAVKFFSESCYDDGYEEARERYS